MSTETQFLSPPDPDARIAGNTPPLSPLLSKEGTPPLPPLLNQEGRTAHSLRRISRRKAAANRANAAKSTGPRTEAGKRRARLNGFEHQPANRSVRLLGLAEARTLRQEPGAAERLYQELIAPYEPAPALLKMHFQDLARLHLELEAWERIRDAQLEHRWQQNDVERRRRYQEMERDLPGTTQEVLAHGLCRLPDSPAKFQKLAEYLQLLKQHLEDRDFEIDHILQMLYGKNVEPDHVRAQTICIRCRKLEPGKMTPVKKRDLGLLVGTVEKEYRDAMNAYLLKLEEKTMTRFACLAGLGVNSIEDQRMHCQGQWLRQAIDRKQKVITDLLKAFRLRPADAARPARADSKHPRNFSNSEESEPTSALESITSAKTSPEANPPKIPRGRPRKSITHPDSTV
jgi:hypothetical protein